MTCMEDGWAHKCRERGDVGADDKIPPRPAPTGNACQVATHAVVHLLFPSAPPCTTSGLAALCAACTKVGSSTTTSMGYSDAPRKSPSDRNSYYALSSLSSWSLRHTAALSLKSPTDSKYIQVSGPCEASCFFTRLELSSQIVSVGGLKTAASLRLFAIALSAQRHHDNTMHGFLHIKEIIDQIIDNLYIPRDFDAEMRRAREDGRWLQQITQRTQYSSLVTLACTSKEFTERCLDLLWWDLDSLVPIFVALGVSIRFFKEKERHDREFGISYMDEYQLDGVDIAELLGNADTERASYYLRRTRNLYTDGEELTPILLESLSAVMRGPHVPILPNVSQIFWKVNSSYYDDDFVYAQDIEMFGSPQVTRLALYPVEVTDSFHEHFPNLTGLDFFNCFTDTEPYDQAIARSVQYFSLHALDCHGYNIMPQTFGNLASMPALHRLCMANIPSVQLPAPRSPQSGPPHPFFTSLTQLDMTATPLATCCDLLRALDNPRALQLLRAGFPVSGWSPAGIEMFISSVSALCSPETLSDLAVTTASGGQWSERRVQVNVETSRVTSAMLRLLLRFTNLEFCDILAPALDCDDAFIESIASAAPRLVAVGLRSLPQYQHHSRLTLRSLYSLAKHCPYLRFMELNHLVSDIDQEGNQSFSGLKRTWDRERGLGVLPHLEIDIKGVDEALGARA
ncbi:hypothetical protein EVG20_g4636 [Dentipellis fragilis]|uniref:Uncharacterized protein n=1 Tax=Dentipellis fragilis TaxID=205917 RepID=A0A4Y9YXH8_9AGAM|nr:hypothetical protein EVG20_g4636 [Dentipellis fragilis]